MTNKQEKESIHPEVILQQAIQELDVFTQSETSRLAVSKEGCLVAEKETRLEKIIGLARCYMGILFSDQIRQEQAKKLNELKQAILQARDTIQSHSALIEKFREGNKAQRKLAEYALSAIQRYNVVVGQDNSSGGIKYNIYNYERQRLLLDQDIQGRQIELPYTVSIKYDSHSDAHPAHKTLKELSQILLIGAVKKPRLADCSKHKKNMQFMIDTVHMKAIRMVQAHLSSQYSMAEILQLVKQTTVDIEDDMQADFITMRQLLEVSPGFFILVMGRFKRNLNDPKFMTMPILDSFRLSFQLTHSAFPYPSQHTGWALADKWVEASPLRTNQVPLFQQVNQRKKKLNHQLLFEQAFIQKVRRYAKLKREVFDQHRQLFLPIHCQIQQVLKQHSEKEKEDDVILETFYKEAAQAPSAFDFLVQTQQQLLDLFVKQPIKALEEEWLGAGSTPLRAGLPQEKFQSACQRLKQHRDQAKGYLDSTNIQHTYLLQQGALIGQAFQAVGLQYLSEKMGFSPPLLNDFERKLQACAFQQLLTFMDECEHRLEKVDPHQIKNHLLTALSQDLQTLQMTTVEERFSLPVELINELEVYFNSRFYALQPRSPF